MAMLHVAALVAGNLCSNSNIIFFLLSFFLIDSIFLSIDYLRQSSPDLPIDLSIFRKICPSIQESVEEEDQGLFNTADLINAVKVAIGYFDKVFIRIYFALC